MNIYGDRGNITVLQKRCQWRGIEVQIQRIGEGSTEKDLAGCDLLVMGGAQDKQQTIVAKDLQKKKKTFSEMIESGVPGLYICGGFQYLGQYYKEADGTIINQLGVLDVYTENPGGERLIGNIAIEVSESLSSSVIPAKAGIYTSKDLIPDPDFAEARQVGDDKGKKLIFVGFENHGGRTRLGPDVKPLGKVLKGFGSNAEDKTEGAIYKNTIGTYFHGPILPKNPELSDWLIEKALEKKYKKSVQLQMLDDALSETARKVILVKMLSNKS